MCVTANCAAPSGDEQPSDDESTETPTADQEKAARDDQSRAKTESKAPTVVQGTSRQGWTPATRADATTGFGA